MSDSSSESVQTTPELNYKADQHERYRSLSWMPTDKYYDAPCGAQGTSAGGQQQTVGLQDLPRLSQVHQELLQDNMRLWECLNILRCTNNRLPAHDVLRKMYAIGDDEFFKRYPAYANFQSSGHGSLDSLEPGGGLYEDQKYVLHLVEHNSGLLRENARLKHCVHLLNVQPERTADEVVSHCFSLDDEDFVKYYPKAERNCRLQASLKRLREESKRHRTVSLPGQILSFRSKPSVPERPGPSRTNNIDRSLNKSCPSAPVAGCLRIDPVYKEGRVFRDHGRRGRAKKPCSESHYMTREAAPFQTSDAQLAAKGRCRSHSPGWQASPGRRSRSKSSLLGHESHPEKRHHSSAGRQIPYMVFQHPYNWANPNESPPTRGRPAKDNDRSEEAQVPAERDKHRKDHSMPRECRKAPLVNSYKPTVTNPPNKKHRGPKISFSKTPAFPLKPSWTKTTPGFNSITHLPPSNPGRPRLKASITPSPSVFPAVFKESSGRKPPMIPRRNTADGVMGKRPPPSLPVTPKKPGSHLPSMPDIRYTTPPPKRPASEAGQMGGRNVQCNYSGGSFFPFKTKRYKDGEQSYHTDRSPSRFNKKVVGDDQRRGPYIPPLQLDSPPQTEEEADGDSAVFGHRLQYTRTRPGRSRFSEERKTSTPLSGRLSRLHSAEKFLFGDKHFRDLNESRKELLDFRNSYCSLLNSVAEFSPDSLEASPEGGGKCAKRLQRLRSPRGQSEERYQDLVFKNHADTTKNNKAYSRSFPRQRQRRLNLTVSTPNNGDSMIHEPTRRRKTNSLQMIPKDGYFLSNDKTHRVPTRRPLFSFRESWLKRGNFKIAERFIRKRKQSSQHCFQNENTNRDTSSLSSLGCTPEDAGHLDISPRYSFMESVQNVFNQLVSEKRQLYEKYSDDFCLSDNAQNTRQDQDVQESFKMSRNHQDLSDLHEAYQEKTSVLDASQFRHSVGEDLSDMHDKHQDLSGLRDQYWDRWDQQPDQQDRPDVWDRHQQRFSVSENNYCTCDLQEQYPDDCDPRRMVDSCDLHEDSRDCLELLENEDIDSGFPRRSSSDPSPRVFSPLDFDSRKHLSFADPLCRTYVSQMANRGEASLDQSDGDSEEWLEEAGIDSEMYSEAIEKLRAETEKLKERTNKCRQDREKWTRGLYVHNSFVDDDENVVCSQYPEEAKKRKNRFHRDTNTNATHNLHPYHHTNTTTTTTSTPSSHHTDNTTTTIPTTTIPTTTTIIIPTTTTTTTTNSTQPMPHSQDNALKKMAEADSSQGTGGSRSSSQGTGGSRSSRSSSNQSAGGSSKLSLLHRVVRMAEDKTWASLQAPHALLGEVAYQLENRIIGQVFKGVPSKCSHPEKEGSDEDTVCPEDSENRHRFYGVTVLSLPQKIRADCKDPKTGRRDSAREARLLHRFQDVISYLRHNFGYHVHKHGKLCQQLIQKHGVWSVPPDPATIARLGLNDFRSVRNQVFRLADREDGPSLMVLLDCLQALGQREALPVLSFR